MKPKNQQDHNLTRNLIKASVNISLLSVCIEGIGNIKNGGVAIDCDSKISRDKIKQHIWNANNNNYNLIYGKLSRPNVILKDFETDTIIEER